MPRKTQKTRTSVAPMQVSAPSSKRSKNRSTNTESQSFNPSHLGQNLMANQVGIMLEDSFFVHDYCTLVVNGSKIALTRRCLRLTRRELDQLLHTYADIVWQRYCASLKKMTTGTLLAEELRQAHQKSKVSQPSKTTILSDLC